MYSSLPDVTILIEPTFSAIWVLSRSAILDICDRAYLLIEGKIFKHGTAEELAEDEQVRRLYLGTNFELKRKDWIIEMGQK